MTQKTATQFDSTQNGMVNKKSDFLIDAVHLFVLVGFALAQPLFDILSRYPEFFVSHKSEPVDVFLLVLSLCFVIPGTFVFVEAVLGIFGRPLRKATHLFFVTGLVAAIAFQVINKIPGMPGGYVIVVASVAGIGVTVAYARLRPFRMFLSVLSPAVLIFPALFLFNSPVYKVVFPGKDPSALKVKVENPPPIVMVIFDEFPVVSLMDERCEIDPVLYPNFAALAQDAYWFRNAVTVAPTTHLAIPAILTGTYPDPSYLPTLCFYPNNLFTLVDDSYDMTVYEMETTLSPKRSSADNRIQRELPSRLNSLVSDLVIVYLHIFLPVQFSSQLPVITQTWKDFTGEKPKEVDKPEAVVRRRGSVYRRSELYAEFVKSIGITSKPHLYFFHSMFPHVPWDRLPSGKRYKKMDLRIPGLNIKTEKWQEDDWLVSQGYQRHLLQVCYVDRMLGDLIKKLKDTKLYDQCLLIITADHGVNFWPGQRRRSVLKDHPDGVLRVPLLIKVPDQEKGEVVDLPVKTIDILPTVGEILNIDIPWKMDGSSVFDGLSHERVSLVPHLKDPGGTDLIRKPCIEKYPSLERKLRLFGCRNSDRLFAMGRYRDLVGRPLSSFSIAKNKGVEISLDDRQGVYDLVDCNSEFFPAAYVSGNIRSGRALDSLLHLAIALNGTIRAVTRTFADANDGISFTSLLPESAFVTGRNHLEILIVSLDEADQPVLTRPKGTDRVTYSLSPSGEKLIRHPDGVSIPIVNNGMDGRAKSRISNGSVCISGWAVDLKNSRLPHAIVILENDRFFFSGIPRIERKDVAAYFGKQEFKMTGFKFMFPFLLIKDAANYRVFAIFDDTASELKYPKGLNGLRSPEERREGAGANGEQREISFGPNRPGPVQSFNTGFLMV